MSRHVSNEARVIPLRPATASPAAARPVRPVGPAAPPASPAKEPLWRDLVGDVLRRERLAQERTLKDVADEARISMPYLSEVERGRKEASSEVLAAAAQALGLGLGDLLSLAQRELTRRHTARRAPAAPYDGLCLVA
ncbi:helix-turn-helix transcriptional regulator [Streptomyces scabiei]|uniref:helix-turn-helix domain-containing protein n=1 Tax=Streptomyces scabiei TaxID=1930 RepID=UPI00299073F6|nr:helix-turn-helix transcriptional regulator [Streptomyces scabiei]MDW8804387.1 helix-turn-helix transcriptional regulator [Streptomyces scabiei]